MCTESIATNREIWSASSYSENNLINREAHMLQVRGLKNTTSNSMIDLLSNGMTGTSVRKIKTMERIERDAKLLRYDKSKLWKEQKADRSPEMSERFTLRDRKSCEEFQGEDRKMSLSRNHLSSSTITISRECPSSGNEFQTTQFQRKLEYPLYHCTSTRISSKCKPYIGRSEADLTIAHMNGDFPVGDRCASFSESNLYSSNSGMISRTPSRLSTDHSVFNTEKSRSSVSSVQSILGGNARIEENQVKLLRILLSEYEVNGPPRIPENCLEYFPQNLIRSQSSEFEMIDNLCSRNDEYGTSSQQHKAIMELVQTEANYIEILEMIINVHVAVFIDIMNKLSVKFRSSSETMSVQISGDSSVRRSRDSFFGKIRSTKKRHDRNSRNISRNSISQSFSYESYDKSIWNGDSCGDERNLNDETSLEKTLFVFGGIGSIYRANRAFWDDCFAPNFRESMGKVKRLGVGELKPFFLKFPTYFDPYILYLQQCGRLISNIGLMEQENKLFAIYSEWTTSNNYMRLRESLTSLMRKPFQRITRYGLLLQRIKSETQLPEEIRDLEEMCSIVDMFIQKIDSMVPDQDSQTSLDLFLDRVDSYSLIYHLPDDIRCLLPEDSMDIKSSLRQLIRINDKPVYRNFIMDIPAKVKFIGGKVVNATCVLLTDLILICKTSRNREHLNICRPPIPLDKLEIYCTIAAYTFNVRGHLGCTVDVYTLTGDRRELMKWIKAVKNATRKLSINSQNDTNECASTEHSHLHIEPRSTDITPRLPRTHTMSRTPFSGEMLRRTSSDKQSQRSYNLESTNDSRTTLKQLAKSHKPNRFYLNEAQAVDAELANPKSYRSSYPGVASGAHKFAHHISSSNL